MSLQEEFDRHPIKLDPEKTVSGKRISRCRDDGMRKCQMILMNDSRLRIQKGNLG